MADPVDLTDVGAVDLAVPRGRNGSFEPQIVHKGQTRPQGFNARTIALYARGMTTRDIRAHLREIYGVEVSPDLISRDTDAVADELAEGRGPAARSRLPGDLHRCADGQDQRRRGRQPAGLPGHRHRLRGAKQVLSLWVGPTTGESAKFWLTVLSELKGRGVADVCIVCCDGLTGLPDAIGVAWPTAVVQLCVVSRRLQPLQK
jgi:putative transposase